MNIRRAVRYAMTYLPGECCWPQELPVDGVDVLIRGTSITPGARRRIMLGGYETAERDMVRRFVQSGDCVLEAGASAGVLTSIIGKRIAPEGRIACVEADERLAPGLRKQLRRNGLVAELVTAMCCPIWEGRIPEQMKSQGFGSRGDSLDGGMGGDKPVRWMTLREVAIATGVEPSVVVIDIEGAESVWIDQSPDFPPTVRLLIVELHWNVLGSEAMAKVVRSIEAEGFSVAGIRGAVFAFSRE